jgi:hypothetical protein
MIFAMSYLIKYTNIKENNPKYLKQYTQSTKLAIKLIKTNITKFYIINLFNSF